MRAIAWIIIIGGSLLAVLLLVRQWPHQDNPPLPKAKQATSASTGKVQHKTVPGLNRPLPQPVAVSPPVVAFAANEEAMADQSVEARIKFAAEMQAKPAQELLDLWLKQAKARNDSLKLDVIADALATRLRDPQVDSSAVLHHIQELFLDPSTDEYDRWQLAQILAQAATRETMATLLSLLASTEEQETRARLLEQIAKAFNNNWSGHYHEDFTDLLANAWKSANAQSDTLPALGNALASVGSQDAMALLFSQIQTGGQTISEFEQQADGKAWIAFMNLSNVRNPSALPILNEQLTAGSADAITTSAAGFCLAKMGIPGATQVLLQYVQASPNDLGAYITDWFSQMRDEGSVKLVSTVVNNATFANQQNRDNVLAVLNIWLSQRSENLRPIPLQ